MLVGIHRSVYIPFYICPTSLTPCPVLCDCSYKGEGVINGSKEKVWECLEPVPGGLRVKWDNNVKKFELLEQVTEVRGNHQVKRVTGTALGFVTLIFLFTLSLTFDPNQCLHSEDPRNNVIHLCCAESFRPK